MLSIYLKTRLCEVGEGYLKVSSRRGSIYFKYIFMKNQSNIQCKVNETHITLIIWKRLSWGWIAGKKHFYPFWQLSQRLPDADVRGGGVLLKGNL